MPNAHLHPKQSEPGKEKHTEEKKRENISTPYKFAPIIPPYVSPQELSFFTTIPDPYTKNFSPVRLDYTEKWDLSLVCTLAESPALATHDANILRDVLANASPEGLYKVTYQLGHKLTFGRLYSKKKLGYTGLTKEIRDICTAPMYDEDDMVNTYPTIMLSLFTKHELPSKFLYEYVKNKDSVFTELACFAPPDLLKLFFITTLHLGNYIYQNNNRPIPFFSHLLSELKINVRALSHLPTYTKFYTFAQSQNRTKPLRTFITYICQVEECKILYAKTLFTEKQFKVAANLYDGQFREKGRLDMVACSSFIKQMTGHDVVFATKGQHTESPIHLTNTPTPTIIKIKGDGNCMLRVAGEAHHVIQSPTALDNGHASCLTSNLEAAREQTSINLTRWLSSVKKEVNPPNLDEYIITYFADNIADMYVRIEGKAKGQNILGSNIDLALFSYNKDILFLIIRTIDVEKSTSFEVCRKCIVDCFLYGKQQSDAPLLWSFIESM